MNCAEAKQKLDFLIDGEIDSLQKEEIERHLQDCPSCQSELARLQVTGTLLKKHLPAAAPAQLDERVLAAFQKHQQQAAPAEEKRSFFGALFGKILIPVPVFALALAVFAIGIGAAYQFGKSSAVNVQTMASETKNDEVKPGMPVQIAQPTEAPLIRYVEIPVTKIVKIPVVREKTITKFIDRKTKIEETPLPVDSGKPEAVAAVNGASRYLSQIKLTQISLKGFRPVLEIKPQVTRKEEN